MPTSPAPIGPYHPSLSAAMGDIPGVVYRDKFGYNPSVGTSAEDIWDSGGTYTGWLTAASTVQIRSGGDVNDTAAGTGARKVRVYGLDENWAEASEEITLAGASASSATTTTFIRVNRMIVTETGTYGGANTGVIDVEDTTGSNLLAEIPAGYGQTHQFQLTVPAGQTGYLRDLHIYVDSTRDATIRLWVRENDDPTVAPYGSPRLLRILAGVSGTDEILGDGIPSFSAKTDVWIDAVMSTGSGGVSVIGTGWFVTG